MSTIASGALRGSQRGDLIRVTDGMAKRPGIAAAWQGGDVYRITSVSGQSVEVKPYRSDEIVIEALKRMLFLKFAMLVDLAIICAY